MRFQVEATVPTKPEDIKAALEAARDVWVKTTPQESDESALKSLENIAATRQRMGKDRSPDPEELRSAVREHASVVERNSAKLDAVHSGCVKLINAGIGAAVAQSAAMDGKPVRVTIIGHFEQSLDGTAPRPLQRLSVHVDIAG